MDRSPELMKMKSSDELRQELVSMRRAQLDSSAVRARLLNDPKQAGALSSARVEAATHAIAIEDLERAIEAAVRSEARQQRQAHSNEVSASVRRAVDVLESRHEQIAAINAAFVEVNRQIGLLKPLNIAAQLAVDSVRAMPDFYMPNDLRPIVGTGAFSQAALGNCLTSDSFNELFARDAMELAAKWPAPFFGRHDMQDSFKPPREDWLVWESAQHLMLMKEVLAAGANSIRAAVDSESIDE